MSIGTTRAQSETIGYVLMIALVIGGAGLVVAIGGAGVVDTQTQNEIERAENSMTLFDSRAAMVALGDADSQTVSLGQDTGSMRVVDDEGWMKITHTNYTGDPDVGTHEEVIFNETLGKVVYEGDDTRLAYQGGGVWRVQDGGEARMISPPEFHYRGQTLTLPVIKVSGQGSSTGSVSLNVQPVQQANKIYPNETTAGGGHVGAKYNATSSPTTTYPARNYTNPVRNGTVSVTVKSEFANGWETYFRERTTGNTTRISDDKVRLTLKTISGPPGSFDLPAFDSTDHQEANGIADGHSINEFTTTMEYGNGGGTNEFSYWDENTSSGEKWELHASPTKSGNIKCGDDPDVVVKQFYHDGDPSGEYEVWATRIPASSSAIDWDCNGGGPGPGPSGTPELNIDFTSTASGTEMAYKDNISTGGGSKTPCDGNQWCFGQHINNNNIKSSVTLGHSGIGSCEPDTYNNPDTSTGCMMGEIVNHYMTTMGPQMDLHVSTGPGGSTPINEGSAKGKLLYDERTGQDFVTFLHITDNEVEVSL